MMNMIILFVILNIFKQYLATTPICDKVCICENLMIVDCARINTKIIPPTDLWPENATDLDLSYNFIEVVDIEISHDQLMSLKLDNNRIKLVNRSIFGGLTNLRFLDLSHNYIEELEVETFYGLENLVSLNISHNLVKTLPQNVFYNLVDIEELILSSNPFSYLEKAHFHANINLKKLDISNIEAHALPFDVFSTLPRFEQLDLSQNNFHEVPTNALRSAKNLKWLKINSNPMEELNQKSFRSLTTLEILEINFMKDLKSVGPKTFSDLVNLKTLEMKVNKQLQFIDPDAFAGLFGNSSETSKIRILDFQLNQLSTLSNIDCKHIEKFNLQNNPWICDCNIKWIRECYFPEIYAAALQCSGPERLRSSLLRTVPEQDFVCEFQSPEVQEMLHHNRIMRTISLAFVCIVLVLLAGLIAFVLKFRSIRTWYRNKRRGPGAVYYVRAKSYPAET